MYLYYLTDVIQNHIAYAELTQVFEIIAWGKGNEQRK